MAKLSKRAAALRVHEPPKATEQQNVALPVFNAFLENASSVFYRRNLLKKSAIFLS